MGLDLGFGLICLKLDMIVIDGLKSFQKGCTFNKKTKHNIQEHGENATRESAGKLGVLFVGIQLILLVLCFRIAVGNDHDMVI